MNYYYYSISCTPLLILLVHYRFLLAKGSNETLQKYTRADFISRAVN
jgi:hypothetical protein